MAMDGITEVLAVLSVKEAAKYACVSEALVRGWLREGGLPHFRLGAKGRRGHYRIAREDLDNFLASFRVTKTGPEPVKALARQVLSHLKIS